MRPEGIYWVREFGKGWTIARWNPVQGWWILAWLSPDDPADPGAGVCSDARFVEIGPRIEPPIPSSPIPQSEAK